MDEKYIIFVSKKYYNKQNCCSRCNKFIEELESRGVSVKEYKPTEHYLCHFDDYTKPEINVLYIYLTKNKYYSDRLYNLKKVNLEREMLQFLTALLGASSITYKSYKNEDTNFSIEENINIGVVDETAKLIQINSEKKNIEKNEMYSGKGAHILYRSTTWEELKENIKEYFNELGDNTMICYDYFEQCPDLLVFVFKRFKFRLLTYKYKIEEIHNSEKSMQVRSILNKTIGLGLDVKSTKNSSKVHIYNIEFYSMTDIKENCEIQDLEEKQSIERTQDIFKQLRYEYEVNNVVMKKRYDDWGGDEKPIYKQCMVHAKERGMYDKLRKWIDQHGEGEFCGNCHWFKSCDDVDFWFDQNLKNI